MAAADKSHAFYATGRRKCAIARVRMTSGSGQILINKRGYEDYFGRATSRMVVRQPLELTETLGRYDVIATVCGGGLAGQADAIKHGISRALCRINETFRPPLKKAGYLTRDPRCKERKKYGQPGARKRFQYSKR
ncbi:MAG TPA: 30S ribosomal protein S9 [Polyangia bacterium]|jgi:small subunit ribosomal protein S9